MPWYKQVVAPQLLAHRYHVLKPLGHGGAAHAFLVHDPLLRRSLTLKLLRKNVPASLHHEFARLSVLNHPNLSQVFDFGFLRNQERQPVPFYTARYVEGSTLLSWAHNLSSRPDFSHAIQPPFVDALQALRFLHTLGLRHGDFKPDNILVDEAGRGVLIDLGCAGPLELPPGTTLSGTRGFLAPELLAGRSVDGRADLYAVGATLAALTKNLPASNPADSSLLALAQKLLAENPDDRPSDVAEVLEALGVAEPGYAPPSGYAPSLLGRSRQMDAFRDALDALLAGQPGPRVLFFPGPDGIGRSRLLREMKWLAQPRCDVVEGVAFSHEPVSSLLSRAIDQPDLPPNLASILDARTRLVASGLSTVLVLDDVHRLDETQSSLFFALVRSLAPSDPILIVAAGRDRPPAGVPFEVLPTLELADLKQWAGPYLTQRGVSDLWKLSGGYPAYVEALLARIGVGELREQHLRGVAAAGDLGPKALVGLTPDEQHALALLAALDGTGADERLGALNFDSRVWLGLQARGWVRRAPSGWRLVRRADAPRIVSLLPDHVAQSHRACASVCWSDRDKSSEQLSSVTAQALRHWAGAGEHALARCRALEHVDLLDQDPQAWRTAVEAVALDIADEEFELFRARAYELAGEPARSLATLARLLRRRPVRDVELRCRQRAASSYLKLGNAKRAVVQLRIAIELGPDVSVRAQLLNLLSRALTQRGAYREAMSQAREGLSLPVSDVLASQLHEAMGVAATYLGDVTAGHEHLRKATFAGADPRARVRMLSYRAILSFREGDVADAIQGYRRALELAETQGIEDQVASAALNLGTAYQQHGDWGASLSSYERGLRIAVALGKGSTEATLRLNLANLYCAIGAFDRAERALQQAEDLARKLGLGALEGAMAALGGEIAMGRRHWSEARSCLLRARAIYEEQQARRDLAEVELSLVAVDLADRASSTASNRLQELESLGHFRDAADLHTRFLMLRAELLIEQSEAAEALMVLEEAEKRALQANQKGLQAETELLLARAFEKRSALDLAESHRARAREMWSRVAASLPPPLRTVFWRHPRRAILNEAKPPKREQAEPVGLRRILEINKRLNSFLSADKVLELAIDAAIELTAAERGFVLLGDGDSGHRLQVAVARNLDHERVGRSHFKFSRSIAERVIEHGEPVVTTDAQDDERFRAEVSVHAMRLRSVACVPIASPQGVLGAIYLDHRFHRGRFGEGELEVLQAFADQVAIALSNARLHAALERRTRELEVEKQRVDELLHGQAREIDRLVEEVRARQEVLEVRYDYSAIVGNTPPMRAIFATLDRVIDSGLNVLIQGESGTGKELVARAIHYNGPRRDARFVSVNCAALPDTLMESEMFGYTRGAFSGADRDHDGLLVSAAGGTFFLDEIGEMSLAMQAKLLRALEQREVRPLGSSSDVPIDIRLVCATNRTLEEEASEGRFREDLFYRVGVVVITLPPLRERVGDIPQLCDVILGRLAEKWGRPRPSVQVDAMRALMGHPWPGNVRQLENVLSRALVMAQGAELNRADFDLPDQAPVVDRRAYQNEESRRILASLQANRWNVSEVARLLGIPRNTLYRKLARYRIARPSSPD